MEIEKRLLGFNSISLMERSGESLQVYLIDDESDPFSIEDYIVLEGSIDKDEIWLAVLQANEGSRDNPEWVDILTLNREFTVGKLLYAIDAYVKPEENRKLYTYSLPILAMENYIDRCFRQTYALMIIQQVFLLLLALV